MNHAQPRLTDITFLAFDTETTGLFPIMHRLVEIGAIRFRLDGRDLATFQQLIDPHIPIPPDVRQVHGITDTMVRGQPTIEHVLPQFIEFLGESDTILLAHNAPFDLGFLAMALTRLGIACPPHYVFDTLEMARRLYPAWHSHSLENVAARLKIANGAEHRALSDARLVKDIGSLGLAVVTYLAKLTLLVKSARPDREEGHTKRLHYLAQGAANLLLDSGTAHVYESSQFPWHCCLSQVERVWSSRGSVW